ncbi:hypothetical protein OSB04_un000021 [Centaurea solstitialis]|uniref:Uncharacterized protein n=1 Tax=Centaurea solstitialis TaxID=347529 RepID=A0AA38VSB9_9ASTR|nr:hypothetical protein OSB04_un000021 [Centaurea solstitialis]
MSGTALGGLYTPVNFASLPAALAEPITSPNISSTSAIPWLKGRPIPRCKNSKIALKSIGKVKKVQDVKFPVKLDKTVEVIVKRPVKLVHKAGNDDLSISDIKIELVPIV